MKYGELNLGQVEAIVNKLGGMEGVRRLLSGQAVMNITKHIVDLDANPFVPDGYEVKEHIKGGQFEWDSSKIALHLDEGQKDGKYVEGNKLCKKLKGMAVFNTNLLDYLLANPSLIPEDWKGKYVFFWGTIYRDSGGGLCVRYLVWRDGQWFWRYRWLLRVFYGGDPAAVRASSSLD